MPKFFVPAETPLGDFFVLTGENAAHAKVLRLKNGDCVTVCDANGTDYQCTVSDVSAGQIGLIVNSSAPSDSEPHVRCSVYMAYAKADKLEHVIQKATELGAAEIVAFPTARCVSRPDAKALKGKLERWQKIAASAAAQCGRGCIPQVTALSSYREALQRAASAELRLPEEVTLAQEYGFQSCTLGPRILRCETAPLCALTAILFACGDLD